MSGLVSQSGTCLGGFQEMLKRLDSRIMINGGIPMNGSKFTKLLVACLISTILSIPLTVNADSEIRLGAAERCPYVCANNPINQGVLIDIIKSIFEKENINVKIVYLPMVRAIDFIKSKKLDGIIGILQRNAPELIFPHESIGQVRFLLYTKDDWIYTGLNSLKSRRIGVESGNSYGIFDSYIHRYAGDEKFIFQIYGSKITKRLIQLLQSNRINLFLEDKNIFDFYKKELNAEKLNEAGSIPPDNLYVGFSPGNKNAQKLAEIFTKGIADIRKTGELDKILVNYGMSDWVDSMPVHRDPFAGDYIKRLEKEFACETTDDKIDTATIIYEGSTAKGGGYWQYAEKFKESIERLSNGRLKVKLKFGVTTEHDIVMNLSEGKSQMGMIPTNNIAPFAPSLGVFTLPYLFPDEEGIKKLFHDPLIDEIADRAALESNVRPLGYFIGGYRLLANTERVVRKTSDLKGLRIRVPRNQSMIETFRSWGVEPIPIAWTAVWPALESGLVQGQENPINIIFDAVNKTQEIWDVLKYITNIHYFMFAAPQTICESFYRQLSDENQRLIRKAAKEAEAYSWQIVKTEDEKTTRFAKSKGMIFVDPINEKEDWQAKARSTWPKLYFRVGGKELVDRVLEIIEED